MPLFGVKEGLRVKKQKRKQMSGPETQVYVFKKCLLSALLQLQTRLIDRHL